jgi:competence protein ComEA
MKKILKKNYYFCLIVFLVVVSLSLGACNGKEEFYIDIESMEEKSGSEEIVVEAEAEKTDESREKEPSDIYVQVCGAVANPGVYTLKEGSRIFEAIDLAGGLLAEGNMASLNQAQFLTDGQMIYVGDDKEQESVKEGQSAADGLVNINTASTQELMTLPGIGEAKSASIIAWREEHGAFQKSEDIMKISGIAEGVFSKIKDKIKVG